MPSNQQRHKFRKLVNPGGQSGVEGHSILSHPAPLSPLLDLITEFEEKVEIILRQPPELICLSPSQPPREQLARLQEETQLSAGRLLGIYWRRIWRGRLKWGMGKMAQGREQRKGKEIDLREVMEERERRREVCRPNMFDVNRFFGSQ